MCDGGRNKRSRSTGANSPNAGPTKSSRRDGKDRARVDAVPALDLDEIPLPCQEVIHADDHSGFGVHVARYEG